MPGERRRTPAPCEMAENIPWVGSQSGRAHRGLTGVPCTVRRWLDSRSACALRRPPSRCCSSRRSRRHARRRCRVPPRSGRRYLGRSGVRRRRPGHLRPLHRRSPCRRPCRPRPHRHRQLPPRHRHLLAIRSPMAARRGPSATRASGTRTTRWQATAGTRSTPTTSTCPTTRDSNALQSTAQIKGAVTGADGLSQFNLDLQPTMTVSAVTVNGAPATFEHDDAELVITPATAVAGPERPGRRGDLRRPAGADSGRHGRRQRRRLVPNPVRTAPSRPANRSARPPGTR